jgi:hypothetical protein
MDVSLGGVKAIPGDIRPLSGPPEGWLRRQFYLPPESQSLVGKEVQFELIYDSLAPKALTSFSVFYPWLTDGCQCQVKVFDDLDCFDCFPHFAAGQSIAPEFETQSTISRGVTVSTDDIILPNCTFDLHWTRRTQPIARRSN